MRMYIRNIHPLYLGYDDDYFESRIPVQKLIFVSQTFYLIIGAMH